MNLRILCIDDSKAIHAYLKDCLKDDAIEFKSVFDGEQAVKFFKANQTSKYDVIFLDWEMPKLSGPEVLDEFKILNVTIPVIMLTSKNDVNDIATVLNKGAQEYIMKPFTKDILLEKLKVIFETGA